MPLFKKLSIQQWIFFAVIALVLGLFARLWHPAYGLTYCLQFESPQETLMPPLRSLPLYMHPDHHGYDGSYYAQLSCDPLLKNREFDSYYDNVSYRARRILLSAVAFVLGGGEPARSVYIYPWLNLFTWLGFAALLWRWFPLNNWHNLVAALGLLCSAGMLHSLRLGLTDGPAFALSALGLFLFLRGKSAAAASLLGLAGLARETVLGAGLFLLSKASTYVKTARNWIVLGLIAALPCMLWSWYVQKQTGVIASGGSAFSAPFAAYIDKWIECISNFHNSQFLWLKITTLLAHIGLTVQVTTLALRRDWSNPAWRYGAAFLLLFALLSTPVWEGHPGAATRVLLPISLAFCLCVPRTRQGFLLLCLGNLSLFSGLELVRHQPKHAEFDRARAHAISVVAEADTRWHEAEADLFNEWRWAKGNAAIQIKHFGDKPALLTLVFDLRSRTPREIRIIQGERELWRGTFADSRWLPITLTGVRAEPNGPPLQFLTDVQPPPGEKRPAAFTLRNFEIEKVEPAP